MGFLSSRALGYLVSSLADAAAGPIPSYLMQSNSSQTGLDMSAQMYSAPQQSQSYHEDPSHHVQQQQQHHLHHRVGREMDDMMADSGFNRTWDMFGGNFKPL